jgi:dipeptidase E
MGKIISIGGGENGRPGKKYETKKIDEEIVRLSGKEHPKVLFIPPASKFQESYFQVMSKVFVKLGCTISPLYLSDPNPNKKEIEQTILSADIIYVGGGNTLNMLKYWRRNGIDKILRKAAEKNIVLSGLSAGAICWFRYAQSDSWKMTNPSKPYIRIKGLDLVPALCAPHFTTKTSRHSDLKNIMRRTSEIGFALEDCCALEIVNDKYRVIASKPHAQAYRVFWKNGTYIQEVIKQKSTFAPLSELLTKNLR